VAGKGAGEQAVFSGFLDQHTRTQSATPGPEPRLRRTNVFRPGRAHAELQLVLFSSSPLGACRLVPPAVHDDVRGGYYADADEQAPDGQAEGDALPDVLPRFPHVGPELVHAAVQACRWVQQLRRIAAGVRAHVGYPADKSHRAARLLPGREERVRGAKHRRYLLPAACCLRDPAS